ncbi:MAG: LTA synthase family protein [Bdellovibrionota bacterium]
MLFETAFHSDLFRFIELSSKKTDFFEKNYIDPKGVQLEFPKKRRNLIYIFLESIEVTAASKDVGGAMDVNLIPELSKLALENTSFTGSKEVLGGASQFIGGLWTMAGVVEQTAGIPLKIIFNNLFKDDYRKDNFLVGACAIGNILKKYGYNQVQLKSADKNFARCNNYIKLHGGGTFKDSCYFDAVGKVPEDSRITWGFDDSVLFDMAKEELEVLVEKDEPFSLTLTTVETHFPGGFLRADCEKRYSDQYQNVLACSSKLIGEFIEWCKQQKFYKNTTIVLAGDHLFPVRYYENLPDGYERKVYFTIINPAIPDTRQKARRFMAVDIFPTTLAALGVDIEGDRLGLGTNLFSDKKTILERFGLEYLNDELRKYSDFYVNVLMSPEHACEDSL